MIIERKSPFSGNVNKKEIDVTEEQLRRWQDGELIQDVMPHISVEDREFIMTGITSEEWDELFKEGASNGC